MGKSVMSGVAGFALGGAFGLFMSSVTQLHQVAYKTTLTCIRCVTIHLYLPQSPVYPAKYQ